MHELAICERIVGAVLEEVGRLPPPPPRLRAVRVVAGQLHQLVPDYLETAYELLTRDTVAEGSALHLEVKPIESRCRACAWEGQIEPPLFTCPECSAPELTLLSGSELYLDRLEVEDDEQQDN